MLGEGHALRDIIESLLVVHERVSEQQIALDTCVRALSSDDPSIYDGTWIGVVTALAFRNTIDDPSRFRSAASVGA